MSNYTLRVIPDNEPLNPRTEWDNANYMLCWHRRYILGDPHDKLPFTVPRAGDHNSWDELERELRARVRAAGDKIAILQPLYLYDHGGITISTGAFSCRFDSGQVGFVFITHKQLRENWNYNALSTKRREQLTKYIDAEVETYDQYLRGDVWGYEVVVDEGGDAEEVIESCWGFYGEETAKEEGQSVLDAIVAEAAQQQAAFAAN